MRNFVADRLDFRVLQSLTGVRLEHATKKHAKLVAKIMRADDAQEVFASGHLEPEKAARASLNRSEEAFAAYFDSDLLAVFGVATFPTGWSSPWALSTVHVEAHPMPFWRASKLVVPALREKYPKMVQMIHARYLAALRWVRRLGFYVEEPTRFGAENTLFCRISMETPKLIVPVGRNIILEDRHV